MPCLCVSLALINGCNWNAVRGSGVAKTESRALASFSKIDLTGSPDVEVAVGPAESVVVTADDNLLPLIETTVKGDTLEIGSHHSYSTSLGVKLKITIPAIDGVHISGSGNIDVTGLKSDDLEAGITGSGNITLKGAVTKLHGHITGSGDLRAGDLGAKNVEVTVTGSGNAMVHATDQLNANVTGSGDIRYSGNPAQVRKNIIGSGDVAPR